VNASSDAISVDRSVLTNRMDAVGRGEFDPATGQFSPGFGAATARALGQGRGGLNGQGRGGPGGFVLGGRGGRGQSLLQGSANYSYGGSALDATNYQPRNGVVTPVSTQPFARNNFGGTVGGPLIIPGFYKNTNRRTSFQANHSGNHRRPFKISTRPSQRSRCATATSQPVRSSSSIRARDSRSATTKSRSSRCLLRRSRCSGSSEPNVDGATAQNFHTAATTLSKSTSVSTYQSEPHTHAATARRRPGGRAGGGGGRGGPAGGRGGRGLTINLSGQLQYRGTEAQQFNILPRLAARPEARA
jgi:hypothetical protein